MRLTLESLSSLRIKRDLLWVGSFTLAASIVWVAYSLYSTYNTTTIAPNVSGLTEPLDPSLDIEILDQLDNSLNLSENFTIYAVEREGREDIRQFTLTRDGSIRESNFISSTINASSSAQPDLATPSAQTNLQSTEDF